MNYKVTISLSDDPSSNRNPQHQRKCLAGPGCRMLPDGERVARRVVPRTAASPLFVVGQALGPDTQRRRRPAQQPERPVLCPPTGCRAGY